MESQTSVHVAPSIQVTVSRQNLDGAQVYRSSDQGAGVSAALQAGAMPSSKKGCNSSSSS